MATITSMRGPYRKLARRHVSREAIIEATVSCFVEIGYFRTTTTAIAKKAGVTRGAVQHYFPTTGYVLEATIIHLQEHWLKIYFDGVRRTADSSDPVAEAVDNMWELTNDRLFTAWQELVSSARTDIELRAVLEPAAALYENLRLGVGRRADADYASASPDIFARWRDTLEFLAAGMREASIIDNRERRIQAQLDWIKGELRRVWET